MLLSGALLVGMWSGPVANAFDGSPPTARSVRTVVVRPGDTLWSIARRVAPGQDPRGVVDAIADANGVEAGSLVPGQTLVLPA